MSKLLRHLEDDARHVEAAMLEAAYWACIGAGSILIGLAWWLR